ncbi:MAG: alcohol dehydrogenase catalytic domain-containing protein [Candidatus Sumerlaeaceae bacterium]|nr:alcohol dehydrogenase catalytic domain-containing protein [Candidatus Sumerlaeaceae bacterium]
MKYLAAVLTSPNRIELQEQRIASRLGRGEVLLKILASGVCGTDLSIYRGDYPVPLPLILGHEMVAEVADAPAGSVARSLVGRRVVCEINNSCTAYGRSKCCEACRRGLSNHCMVRTVTGIIAHPGAFAEYLVVPAGNLHVVPRTIDTVAASLVEPLAAAIRTFELSPVRDGKTVVVLGCGRLGRLVALVAAKSGARVIAVGRSATHLDLIAPFAWKRIALQKGSGAEIRPRGRILTAKSAEEIRTIVLDLTRGLGADIAVEATGVNANLLLARRLVRPQGIVAMKSTSGVPVQEFDTTLATVDEITFQGSRCGPFDKAIRFMRQHGIPNESWVTARFGLEDTAKAIEAAAVEPKVLIEP